MQKILLVIHEMRFGGAEKILAFLANNLSSEDNDIHLLTYENNDIVQFIDPRVNHVDFKFSPPSVFGIRRILQIYHVRKVIAHIKPDVIVSFLTYPNMISILASVGKRIPVIISERGDPYVFQSWGTRLRDFIYNFADGYVFQSYGAKNYYKKRIQEKAIVIPNPVFAENVPPKFMGNKEDIIVSVGRLELKQKRQDILIYAFSKIANKYPSIKLLIFGEGDDETKIKRIIVDCKLDDRVVLAGVTKNVYESIINAKLFVLSSDYEGIPNALIEAMSIGLPCISTDCSPGGAAELIKNMENGILVKVGSIDELANAIELLINNPQIAESMGQKAMHINNDLNAEPIIKKWKEYINLISSESPNTTK